MFELKLEAKTEGYHFCQMFSTLTEALDSASTLILWHLNGHNAYTITIHIVAGTTSIAYMEA